MNRQPEDVRQRNQAEFWNEKQARAKTAKERVAVWYDACRMLVREAERNGDPALSEAFTKHLHSFFQSHRG